MSISALVFLLVYGTGIVLTFRRPHYGVLTYIFEWHNHPPYYWWGNDIPDNPLGWSFTVAIATLISWVINRNKLSPLEEPDFRPVFWVILMVINMYWVSFVHAIVPDLSYGKAFDILKIAINFILMISVIRTYKDYRQMIWVMIVCVGYMGWIAYNEGSNRNIGVLAPNATEENAVSAHVMTVLAFVGVYFLTANRWAKIIAVLVVPFGLNLIILANSRATFVGLLAIGALAIFLFRGKVRFAVIFGVIAIGLLFFQLTNEQFTERQSMETYDDGSSTKRLRIWEGAYEVWKDHPYGVGGGGFIELSPHYVPELYDEGKSQHNTFIATVSDWGFFGIILYLGFLTHIIYLTVKIKRLAKKVPALQKFSLEATAVQMALVGISAAGIFHSRQYAEIVYWICAFAIMLYNIQKTEHAKLQEETDQTAPQPVEETSLALQNSITK